MPRPFFPDPTFGWVFVGVLAVLVAVAAVYDTRTAVIPKWVTLGTLAAGLAANVVRGAWQGSQNGPLWLLGTGSPWAGAADGLLFALAGFAFAFVLYFGIWVLGVCGGGDVKLMAALGAWLGYVGVIFLLVASTVVLVFWLLGKVLVGGLSPRGVRKTLQEQGGPGPGGKPGRTRVTFSVPAAVGTVIVALWLFRVELQLARPNPAPPRPQGTADVARPLPPA